MIYRDRGKKVLHTILNHQKNINIVEKYIFEISNTNEEYMRNLYETIALLHSTHKNLKQVLCQLHTNQMTWNAPVYKSFKEAMDEEDDFINNPFEIEEGVIQCHCGSKKTISFQKQTRSADEGSTTFSQCVECGKRWRHNN